MSDGWPDPPAKLADRDIWLIWEYDERIDSDGNPYQTKMPLDPRDGGEGDAADRDKGGWTDFESAVRALGNYPNADGIGFAFPKVDTLVGIDLDDIIQDGELLDWARDIIDRFDSYTELSPSGTGVHIIIAGIKPGDKCRKSVTIDGEVDTDGECEVEIYGEERFFTYTGDTSESAPDTVNERDDVLAEVYEEYLGSTNTSDTSDWDGEAPDLDLDDEQVLEKARNAKNGEKFKRLESGSDAGYNNDTSGADQAFVNLLAFYTGGDRSQIDRLFQASGRMRDKWLPENHSTYRKQTIDTALSGRTEFYEPGGGDTPDVDTDDGGPKDWVQAAWDEHAETIADPSGPGELGEAVEQTIDVLVAAHANGMARPTADMWLKEISDQSSKAYTKSGLADLFERRMDAAVGDGATGEGSGVAPRVPEFMEDHLKRVIVNRVTDHNVDTSYQWHFNGDLDVVFSTTGGTHWDWYQFRERYFDETGVDLREPSDGSAEDWRAFVVELIDERGEESQIRGPRTETIGALKNYIERRTAYGDIDAAALREGVYLDGEDADELWVLSKDIQRLCAEREVETRGLQEELRARGLTTGNRVAERRRSSGTRVTWWRLSADIAEPRTYEDGEEIANAENDSNSDAEEHE